MAFEVALFVIFKTTRNEFRNNFATDRRRGKMWIGYGVSTLILALGFGVLNQWAAAGNAAKTRGSAISEGRSPRERRHREATHQNFRPPHTNARGPEAARGAITRTRPRCFIGKRPPAPRRLQRRKSRRSTGLAVEVVYVDTLALEFYLGAVVDLKTPPPCVAPSR